MKQDKNKNNNSLKWVCSKCGSDKRTTNKSLCQKCYMREWYKTEKGKANIKKNMNKDSKERKARYAQNNKEKIKAKSLAQHYIKVEGLCEVCKENQATQRHHPDYSKPLEVVLVCKDCHYSIHKKLKDMENIQ